VTNIFGGVKFGMKAVIRLVNRYL